MMPHRAGIARLSMGPEPRILESSPRLRDALLVVLVAAALVLPPVGQRQIVTSHEARFALLARDMVERRVWFDARFRGRPYRNKPPLHPWTIVASSWLTGRVSEGAAQLPSALATIATVLGTFLLGDRLFHRRAGLCAALVLATGYGVFSHSQMILPDVLTVAFGVMAGYYFWCAMTGPRSRTPMALFYVMLALGAFTKGPAGLLPLAVAAVWLWAESGPAALARLWSPLGMLLFIGLTLVWLTPFLTLGDKDFVGGVVVWDWLHYYLRAPRPDRIASQLLELLTGFLPWTLVAPMAVIHALRKRSEPEVRFAMLWFAVQFVLIMLSTNQRVRYLLSLYPGAALLVAWWAVDGQSRVHRLRNVLALSSIVLVLATVAAYLAFEAWPRDLLPSLSWRGLVTLAGLLLVGIAILVGLGLGRRSLLMAGVAGGMAVALGSGIWIYNGAINRARDFKALAAAIDRTAGRGDIGVFAKGEYLQLDFYLHRDLTPLTTVAEALAYLAKPERFVVVNQQHWELWRHQLPPKLELLHSAVVGGEVLRLVRPSP